MKISELTRNDVVLKEIGRRIAQKRIRQNRSQEVFARAAGISRSGLQRLESGDAGVRVVTLASALRALGLAQAIDALVPEDAMTPIEIAKVVRQVSGKTRKRASRKMSGGRTKMTWGDGSAMDRGSATKRKGF